MFLLEDFLLHLYIYKGRLDLSLSMAERIGPKTRPCPTHFQMVWPDVLRLLFLKKMFELGRTSQTRGPLILDLNPNTPKTIKIHVLSDTILLKN